jgi:hypothetical protein
VGSPSLLGIRVVVRPIKGFDICYNSAFTMVNMPADHAISG